MNDMSIELALLKVAGFKDNENIGSLMELCYILYYYKSYKIIEK